MVKPTMGIRCLTSTGQKPAETQIQHQEQEGKQLSRAVTPNRSPTTIEFDPRIHNMINQLSPSQLQQLLASLAAQTLTDAPTISPSESVNPSATSSLTQYQPHFDFSQTNPSFNQLPIVDGLISFDNYEPQLPGDVAHSVVHSGQQEHEQGMEKQLRGAEVIGKDLSTVDTSINTLIQHFGLDPSLFDGLDQNQSEMNEPTEVVNASHASTVSEFDFDSFFNNLSNGPTSPDPTNLTPSNPGTGSVGMDYDGIGVSSGMSDLTSAAFLDEVDTPTASSDMTASPVQPMRQVSPDNTTTGTSDADSSPAANLSTLNLSSGGVMPFNTTGKGRWREETKI
jgi:heat shock transcription factor